MFENKEINHEEIYKVMARYITKIYGDLANACIKLKVSGKEFDNIVIIFAHLLAIVYAECKDAKGVEKAEELTKELMFDQLFARMNLSIRKVKEYFDYTSNVITTSQSIRRMILSGMEFQGSTFQEQMAIGTISDALAPYEEYLKHEGITTRLIQNITFEIEAFENEMKK